MSRIRLVCFCIFAMIAMAALVAPPALAQDAPRIISPQDNEQVRGEITVKFDNILDGGYAIIKIDDSFRQATYRNSFQLNTFVPNFPGDGPHTLTVVGINAAGKRVGETKITFNIANNSISASDEGVLLRHWVAEDRLRDSVQRYRIFAVSDATIEGGAGDQGGAGGGAGAGSPGGGGEEEENWIPAPLDWQVCALVRRVVRDVGMIDGAANIRSIVQQAVQRQRLSESGDKGNMMNGPGGASTASTKKKKKKKKGPSAPTKAPWNMDIKTGAPIWEEAPETGLYFVKMLKQTGEEINATRKSPPVALGDLLPTFPEGPVRRGMTWETSMTFVAELSTREPVPVKNAPITFTAFETIKTPGGAERRTAKLESRFPLNELQSKQIALKILSKSSAAKGGGSLPVAGGMASDEERDIEDIETARTRMSRVLWFDIENRRVLRSEDVVDTYFEEAQDSEAGAGGGATGGQGGGKVSYNLRVTTWYDDTLPPASVTYTAGAGTAHGKLPGGRDQSPVQDPGIQSLVSR